MIDMSYVSCVLTVTSSSNFLKLNVNDGTPERAEQ